MLTKPSLTMLARPQVLNAYAEGAGRGNDDTALLQALMDEAQGTSYNNSKPLIIEFPWSEAGYTIDAPGLKFKASNTHLVGIGGQGFAQVSGVTLNFVGTGADESAMITADKTADNSGQNYQGNSIQNLVLDGHDAALHGLKLHGWTRYCTVKGVVLTRMVNPIYVTDGFYSIWDDVECQINTISPPVGMSQGAFDVVKFGAYFSVCHDIRIDSLKMFVIGGDTQASGDIFDAVVKFSECDVGTVRNLSIESCNNTTYGRNNRTMLDVAPGCTMSFDSAYIEDDEFYERAVRVNDNSQAVFTAWFFNGIEAPILFDIGEEVGVTFNNLTGFNLDCATAMFNAISSATVLRNVTFNGGIALQAGGQDGTLVDAGTTTNSLQGIASDGIVRFPSGDTEQKNGYGVTLGTTYIEVGSGSAVVFGQAVGWSRASGLQQRLYPDLSYVGTWNVKVSGCGAPFIEKTTALRAGSGQSLALGTFTTPGSGGAPASWTPA